MSTSTSTSPNIELFSGVNYNTAGKCVGTYVGAKCTVSGRYAMKEALLMGQFMQQYVHFLQSGMTYDDGDEDGTLQNALEF